MKFIFDSTDEIAAFYEEFLSGDDTATGGTGTNKRKRRTKAEIEADKLAAANAAAGGQTFQPPPTGQAPAPTFTPAAPGATGFPAPGGATGFPAPGAPAAPVAPVAPVAPAQPDVNPLVAQIIQVAEGGLTSGQPMESVLGWFRQGLATAGLDASQADWNQIKTAFLPKTPEAVLKSMAVPLGIKVA